MSTSGHLKFQGTNRATFVGTTSNIMFDTTSTSLGIGVTGTDHPSSNLYITGNAYVSSNIAVGGVLTMGTVNVVARHDLEAVTALGNTTPVTLEFTNPTTSLVASGNVVVTGNVTADHFVGDGSNITGISSASNLQVVSDTGNVTSNTVQFSNAITGFVTTANIEVGTANLFVDTSSSRVGIGTSSPETTLHVTNQVNSTGTGDAYLDGVSGVVSKPTECLRLQGKYHNLGSGALMRFTNQHNSGTNPNTGEYNLAGIAGYDHDNSWGGGLAFYTSPGSGSGGDNLKLRMTIDSIGAVNIPGPTTGATHSDGGILYLLDTPIIDEWSWTGSTATTLRITYASSELPANCKAVLAEVFMPKSNNVDHVGHSLGKNYSSSTVWTSGGNVQPSTRFTLNRQTTFLDMRGDTDNFEYYYGKWFSSVIIPLDTGNTVYHIVAGESSGTSSWVYVVTRGYYI